MPSFGKKEEIPIFEFLPLTACRTIGEAGRRAGSQAESVRHLTSWPSSELYVYIGFRLS